MNKIVTAPSVEANNELYGLYKSLPGNNSATKDDFYSFLTTPGVDRDFFLQTYCESNIDIVGNVLIHKVIMK